MRITLFSDPHTKHNRIVTSKSLRKPDQPLDFPGGGLLMCAGDVMSSGYDYTEFEDFCKWFDGIDNYDTKIFIGGNHDRVIQDDPEWSKGILTGYKNIDYLQDEDCVLYFDGPNGDHPEDNIRIYGSPWQPEFRSWAFNLPRNGDELKSKWDAIPDDTDILITHTPPWGTLDDVEGKRGIHLGCELLAERVKQIKPKIHLFGHIHSGYGYYFDGHTHFFNVSILNEQYQYTQAPITFDWDQTTNIINWL